MDGPAAQGLAWEDAQRQAAEAEVRRRVQEEAERRRREEEARRRREQEEADRLRRREEARQRRQRRVQVMRRGWAIARPVVLTFTLSAMLLVCTGLLGALVMVGWQAYNK